MNDPEFTSVRMKYDAVRGLKPEKSYFDIIDTGGYLLCQLIHSRRMTMLDEGRNNMVMQERVELLLCHARCGSAAQDWRFGNENYFDNLL